MISNGQLGILSGAILMSAGFVAGPGSESGGMGIALGGLLWIVIGLRM